MSSRVSVLKKLYELYLYEYKSCGCHPHPANLLAMLLLPEKDKFEPLMVSEGEFYQAYNEQIDSKIKKVVNDFNITNEEIIAFLELKGFCCEDVEYDKVWDVFYDGFGIMHGELMYRPGESDYEMYNLMDNKFNMYKMTENGLEEYKVGRKRPLARRVKCCLANIYN
ncbi:MAG: hypothetical protein E7159_04790 [Firmicutes bacterium]|nr:hypothetical protein [Bacillota bacterium]